MALEPTLAADQPVLPAGSSQEQRAALITVRRTQEWSVTDKGGSMTSRPWWVTEPPGDMASTPSQSWTPPRSREHCYRRPAPGVWPTDKGPFHRYHRTIPCNYGGGSKRMMLINQSHVEEGPCRHTCQLVQRWWWRFASAFPLGLRPQNQVTEWRNPKGLADTVAVILRVTQRSGAQPLHRVNMWGLPWWSTG